jgi:superkiller protein 3
MNLTSHSRCATLALLLLAAAAGFSQAKPQSSSVTAEQAINAASDLVQKGQFAEAATLARKAVALAPASAIAHNLLGVIEEQLKDVTTAKVEYERAIQLDPKFAAAYANLGNLLLTEGKTGPARVQLQRAISLDPNNARAHYNLALLLVRTNEFAAAADQFGTVLKFRGEDPALAIMFIGAALKAEQTPRALAAADSVTAAHPADATVLFNLALLLAQNGQYEKASELFGRVNELKPGTPEVLYNLGVAEHNLKHLDAAARALAEAADLKPELAEAHFRLGLIASERLDHENAILEFQHAAERSPNRAQYHYLLGREWFAMGRWELAATSYEKAAQLDPKQSLYALSLGNAQFRAENYAAAASAFEITAHLDPKTEDIQYLIGYCYRVQGLLDKAKAHLLQQIQSDPKHVKALDSLGFILLEQGDAAGAQSQLEKAVGIDPYDLDVLFDLARTYARAKLTDQAIQAFEHVLLLSPENTQAHYQLFLLYSRTKRNEDANRELAEFQRLQELEKMVRREEAALSKARRAQAGSVQTPTSNSVVGEPR